MFSCIIFTQIHLLGSIILSPLKIFELDIYLTEKCSWLSIYRKRPLLRPGAKKFGNKKFQGVGGVVVIELKKGKKLFREWVGLRTWTQ